MKGLWVLGCGVVAFALVACGDSGGDDIDGTGGTGGSGATGGSAGSGAGGSSGSGGAAGSGGATGGSAGAGASGGSSGAGGATGGASGSGGSSGAGGTGGAAGSGGAGGAAGSGGSGGSGDPVQACLDQAGGSACNECACRQCINQIVACNQDPRCLAIIQCAAASGCSGIDCYGLVTPGPCRQQIDAGGGPLGQNNPQTAVGKANLIDQCRQQRCRQECN